MRAVVEDAGWGFVEIPGVSPSSGNPWYVTASHFVRGGAEVMPGTLLHAKRMGTTTTACGVPAMSWHKRLDMPFPPVEGRTCQACLSSVLQTAEPSPGRRRLSGRSRASTRTASPRRHPGPRAAVSMEDQ